jgi:hypothetical protein
VFERLPGDQRRAGFAQLSRVPTMGTLADTPGGYQGETSHPRIEQASAREMPMPWA